MNSELTHYGVLGMKWGVRRYQNKDGTLTSAGQKRAVNQEAKQAKKNAKTLLKEQKKWDKNFNRHWWKAYNATTEYVNSVMLPKMNKKYDGVDFSDPKNQTIYRKFEKEYLSKADKIMTQKVEEMFGKRPG
jgi:hypothetical protein